MEFKYIGCEGSTLVDVTVRGVLFEKNKAAKVGKEDEEFFAGHPHFEEKKTRAKKKKAEEEPVVDEAPVEEEVEADELEAKEAAE